MISSIVRIFRELKLILFSGALLIPESAFAQYTVQDSVTMSEQHICNIGIHSGESRMAWTLDDCISYALEHNISIKRKKIAVSSGNEGVSEAKWSYAPSFSVGSNYSISTGRVLDQTTYDFVENEVVGSSSSSLSCSMDVFNGFRKHRKLQKAKLDLKADLMNLETAKNDLRANVTAAYLEVLCAREGISEAEQIVSQLEIQADKIRIKVEAGKITESDLQQISSQLYSAKNDVLSAFNTYDMARLELCRLLEIDDFASFEVASSESVLALASDMLSSALAVNVIIDLKKTDVYDMVSWRPEIKLAEIEVEMARKDLQIARSSYWPNISLSAGYGASYSDARQKFIQNPDGTFRYETYSFFSQYVDNASSYLSVSLNIPIFSGLSVRKNVRRSRLALSDAEYALELVRKDIVKEAMRTSIDVRTAIDKYAVALEQVKYAEKAASQVTVKYESGAVDIVTYSTAISELASARFLLLSAKYECIFKHKLLSMFDSGSGIFYIDNTSCNMHRK